MLLLFFIWILSIINYIKFWILWKILSKSALDINFVILRVSMPYIQYGYTLVDVFFINPALIVLIL